VAIIQGNFFSNPIPKHFPILAILEAPQLPLLGKNSYRFMMEQNYLINNFAIMRRLFRGIFFPIQFPNTFQYWQFSK
jgi:hypothetical protein